MNVTIWRCPVCDMTRPNMLQLNHIHDGKVVPFDYDSGPTPIDVSGRFSPKPADEAPAPPRRPGRPRKTA